MKHYSRAHDDNEVPFKPSGRGAWMSWVALSAALGSAFTAGVWATNVSNEISGLKVQVSQIQNDVSWLVRREGGHSESKPVAVTP
jgi:hypothetical protein